MRSIFDSIIFSHLPNSTDYNEFSVFVIFFKAWELGLSFKKTHHFLGLVRQDCGCIFFFRKEMNTKK
jgi:hypothetical protein